MPSQIGYFDTLKSVAGKVLTFLSTLTLTGTDGKTLTVLDNCTVGGAAVNPTLPAFAVTTTNKANETGDGTAYTVVWSTEITDQGGNFAANTFTAPVTGKYNLFAMLDVYSLAAAHNSITISIVTSNRTYVNYSGTFAAGANPFTEFTPQITVLSADMDAGDTAYVVLTVSGGTKVVDLAGGGSFFGGHLVC